MDSSCRSLLKKEALGSVEGPDYQRVTVWAEARPSMVLSWVSGWMPGAGFLDSGRVKLEKTLESPN